MKKQKLATLVALWYCAHVASSATAQTVSDAATVSGVAGNPTANYFQAKAGIDNGDDIALYSNLSTHPLYPYLAATFYRRNLNRDSEITALFAKHYSAIPVKKLHNRWIEEKFNQGDYAAISQHYFHTGNETAECAYRSAQLALGNRQAALENIDWLWLKPKSVSALCDPVFAAWDKTEDSVYRLKRARLAYHAGNADFAIQLANRLPYDDPNQAILLRFADFLKYPESLLSVSAASLTDSELARDLLPTALAKLVRIDSSRYAAFAMQFAVTMTDNSRYQAMLSKLTGYLANRSDPQAQYTYGLLSDPDKNASESLLRYLVGARDWAGIREAVSLDNNHSMALYWLGRALEQDSKDATAAYQKAAQTRSYYGFLAADKIGQAYHFDEDIIQANAKVQGQLDGNTSLQRAELLARYGDALNARREILPVAKVMNLSRKRQLAKWLSNKGFHFETIYILGQAKAWNDINVRFPTPYNRAVDNVAKLTGVDATWIYAIMRQESSMNPRANSRAKARGLMQLIPSTARLMAKNQGISLYGDDIYNPMINAQLGAAYLAKMYYRFGNIALASAAYNAGPGRVDNWSARDMDDMTIWVEKIPFNETRKYVKNILEYQQVYAKHLGVTIPTITERLTGRYQAVK